MTKEETWNRYQKANVPVVRKSLQEDYLKADPILNKAIFKGVETGEGGEKVAWWNICQKIERNMFSEVIFDKKTPEEALKTNYEAF